MPTGQYWRHRDRSWYILSKTQQKFPAAFSGGASRASPPRGGGKSGGPKVQPVQARAWFFCPECQWWAFEDQAPCCPCETTRSPGYKDPQAKSYAEALTGQSATPTVDPMRQALELLLQSPQLQGNESVAQALQGALAQLSPSPPAGTEPTHEAALAKVRSLHLHRANNKKYREETRLFSMQNEITAVQEQLDQLQGKLEVQKNKLFDAIYAVSKAEALQYGEGVAATGADGEDVHAKNIAESDHEDMDQDGKSDTLSADGGDGEPPAKQAKRNHGQVWVKAEQARVLAQLSYTSRKSFGAASSKEGNRPMPYQQTATTEEDIRNLLKQAHDAAGDDKPGFQQALMESLQCL